MALKNSTLFFIPVWFDNFRSFTSEMAKMQVWDNVPTEEFTPRYFLNYVTQLATSPDEFCVFNLRKDAVPNIYMCEDKLSLSDSTTITQVRFSAFGTGVGFLEYLVEYGDLSFDEITNFAYRFKKAKPYEDTIIPEGKVCLYNASRMLLPKNVKSEIFFTRNAGFKNECHCFHMLYTDKDRYTPDQLEGYLRRLRRTQSTSFDICCHDDDYDMLFKPYTYDLWAGSQESLVNISTNAGDSNSNYFIENFKPSQLSIDYHFMYLMLLNQRYSAIQYISQIARTSGMNAKQIEKLNQRIVKLKTTFAFNVVSDDQMYQNIYVRLYKVFDIDRLLKDIQDNEAQMEILRNTSSAKTEKRSSHFLAGISLLSLFSALIDAASYFDRWPALSHISTILSLFSTIGIVVLCVVLFFGRSK